MDDLTSKMQELLSDPESMKQISELAAMLKEESNAADPPAAPDAGGGFDPGMLMKLGELMQSRSQPDKNTALLLALKPHLGERRQLRVDKAVKLLRLYSMWRAAQQSGMLHDLI